jgi:hypothetical protein
MEGSVPIARDPRVGRILKDPDRYFATARRRALARAREDVEADLTLRALGRRNGRVSSRRNGSAGGEAS